MSPSESKRLHAQAAWLLFVAAAFSLIVHTIDARFERQDMRAERAARLAILARIEEVRQAPASDYIYYANLRPIEDPAPLGPPIQMLSSGWSQDVRKVEHMDTLRCSEPGQLGELIDGAPTLKREWISEQPANIPQRNDRTFGDVEPRPGARHVSGLWRYSMGQPDRDMDCVIEANPCAIVRVEGVDVPKCIEVFSDPIRLRSPVAN